MKRLSDFIKNNIANIVGVTTGIFVFLITRGIARIIENYYIKESIKELSFKLRKEMKLFNITELDASKLSNWPPCIIFAKNLCHIREKIDSTESLQLNVDDSINAPKSSVEMKRRVIALIDGLEYLNGRIIYEKVRNSAHKISDSDKNKSLFSKCAKTLELTSKRIFSNLKLLVFGAYEDVLIQDYLLNLKGEFETGDILYKRNPDELIAKVAKRLEINLSPDILSNNSQAELNLWKIDAYNKYMIKKDNVKICCAPKALKILTPIVAICAGFAARKALNILTRVR